MAISVFLALFQAEHTGTVVGLVKLPNGPNAVQAARIALLPPKYTELWNRQAQTRLDNYWELFKPEFAVNKERFLEFQRMAQVEALRYVTSNMRRELGDGASKFLRDDSPSGQFEFKNIPFGTYQLLVQGIVNGQEVIWSRTVVVQTEVPIFIDPSKPVS
jgi:hypothetical protein